MRKLIKRLLREQRNYGVVVPYRIADQLGYPIDKYISSGTFADVYLLKSGRVLKIVYKEEKFEVEFSTHFHNNPHRLIIPIYEIHEIGDYFVSIEAYATNTCEADDSVVKSIKSTLENEVASIIDVRKCNIGKYNGEWVIIDGYIEDIEDIKN